MGMSQVVRCSQGVPEWPRVAAWLAERGVAVQLRMIDGQLALPDETPGPEWDELRVGTPAGMITIRRRGDSVELTIWGNSDRALQDASAAMALGFAELGAAGST